MKLIISFVLISLLFVSTSDGWRHFWKGRRSGGNLGDPTKNLIDEVLPTEQWFTQPLDYFYPRSNNTWRQRYFVNDKYYKENGPIFLMIGGHAEANAKWMVEGAWIEYAREFNALCFLLEHRYYGKSRPTSDLSTKNLLFLATDQVLGDLASFIDGMNKKYNLGENAKWITFGGSYAGTLATGARIKFPHFVHGSVSSSGPLLAKVDFYEYYQAVEQSLATHCEDCVKYIEEGIKEVELLLNDVTDQRNLNEIFNLCDPIEHSIGNPLDISNLFENIASNFAEVVQYNDVNTPHAKVTIDDVCTIMINTTIGAPVNRLATVIKLILDNTKQNCLDYKYDKMIEEIKNISWEAEVAEGARQWTYQTCSELGIYPTSNDENSTFGGQFPADFFVNQCTLIFGDIFNGDTLTRAVRDFNWIYGGLRPHTTNVIYIHGSIDPWHKIGLTTFYHRSTSIIFLEGTAHCADIYEPSENDLPQLIEARSRVRNFIQDLLNQV